LENEGHYRSSCRDIAVAPSNSSIVYAVGQIDDYAKIWRSEDAGNSWIDITENLESMHTRYDLIYAIWVAPENPYNLIVGTSNGVYRTMLKRDPRICDWNPTPLTFSTRAFAYDHAKGTLYAATEREGVYYTNDRGLSWGQLNDGLESLETLCIGLDSENDLLFIGTDGGSVWRLNLGETNPPQPPVSPPPPEPPGPIPPPKGRGCFLADTPVWVNGALVNISNVVSGQMVGEFHCNPATDCLEQIETVEEHEGTFECRDIVLESGNRISVVDAHCFMLDSGKCCNKSHAFCRQGVQSEGYRSRPVFSQRR
jgi:hypothetical protein